MQKALFKAKSEIAQNLRTIPPHKHLPKKEPSSISMISISTSSIAFSILALFKAFTIYRHSMTKTIRTCPNIKLKINHF